MAIYKPPMKNPNALTADKFDRVIEQFRQEWFETDDATRKAELEQVIHEIRLHRQHQGFGYGL